MQKTNPEKEYLNKFEEIVTKTINFFCCSDKPNISWTATVVIYNGLFWHWLKLLDILEHVLPDLREHYRQVDCLELGYKVTITNNNFVKSILSLEIQAPLTIEQANISKFISPKLKLFSPCNCYKQDTYKFTIYQHRLVSE